MLARFVGGVSTLERGQHLRFRGACLVGSASGSLFSRGCEIELIAGFGEYICADVASFHYSAALGFGPVALKLSQAFSHRRVGSHDRRGSSDFWCTDRLGYVGVADFHLCGLPHSPLYMHLKACK